MTVFTESIARALGGKRSGRGWLCRCPAHDDRNPSLSLSDGDNGRLLTYCHAGCDTRNVLAVLQRRGLLGGDTGADQEQEYNAHIKAPGIAKENILLDWSPRAEAIWNAAIPIVGMPAATYLRHRGGIVPDSDDIRFLPAKASYPAMLARVRDAMTGMPITLHFTALLPDGTGKAPVEKQKRFLWQHRSKGGVILLTDDAEVTMGLGLTEGIENAAVCMAMGWRPIWAAGNAGNIGGFPVLPGIECLTVFADHDKTGLAEARRCADRWRAAGREVRIVMPSVAGNDWADVAKGVAL